MPSNKLMRGENVIYIEEIAVHQGSIHQRIDSLVKTGINT